MVFFVRFPHGRLNSFFWELSVDDFFYRATVPSQETRLTIMKAVITLKYERSRREKRKGIEYQGPGVDKSQEDRAIKSKMAASSGVKGRGFPVECSMNVAEPDTSLEYIKAYK